MKLQAEDLVAVFCLLGLLLMFSFLVWGWLYSLRRERSMVKNKSKFDQSMIDQPARLPFVKDKPRVYVLTNMAQHKTVRAVGMTFPAALLRLGWDEKDVMAVDLGPTTKFPCIVEYQAVQIQGDFPTSDGREVGKE